MKTGAKIALGVGIVAGIAWFVNTILKLDFFFKRIHLLFVDSNKMTFQAEFYIKNTTLFEVLVQSIDGEVLFNGTPVAFLDNTPINTRVRRFSMNEIAFMFNVEYKTAIAELWRQIQTGSATNWRLSIIGNITVDGMEIPFTQHLVMTDIFP